MSAPEEIRQDSRSSVKISMTAAGKPLVEVKVYADRLEGFEDVDAAQRRAVAVFKQTLADVTA